MRRETTLRDDRAVAISTGYIINLGVATVAISIFLLSLQGVFTDVTDSASDAQVSVAGEKLAEEIEKMDRLSRRTEDGAEPSTTVEMPRFDTAYTAEVRANSTRGVIIMASGTGDTLNVTFSNSTAIVDADEGIRVQSGTSVTVRHDPGNGLVIE